MEYKLYLAHHGIKGMKWGVRRYQNKDGSLTPNGKKRYSRADKDMDKLVKATSAYYDRVNKRNALYDTGGSMDNIHDQIRRDNAKAQKLVKKLARKYANVEVNPQFEKNGYVVKGMEATIAIKDRYGRISVVKKRYAPVETYNHWRKEAEPRLKKESDIRAKYEKKLAAAKSADERALIEFDMMDELDKV